MKGTAVESELKCVIAGFLFTVRYALLFDIADRIVGFHYRRFGTTYRIHLDVQEIQEKKDFFDFFIFEDGIDELSRNVGTKL